MLPARSNPFRMDRIEALRFRLDDTDWRRLMARFASRRFRGMLVGPHGSGKTTLREAIERHLAVEGWGVRALVLCDQRAVRWPDMRDLASGAGERTLISLDGVDRLKAPTWWRFVRAARAASGILATSHVPGRLPTLHVHETSAALLRDLAAELCDDADPAWLASRSCALFETHRGDIRACLRALYDEAERIPRVAAPQRRSVISS
jgi:hypothetical protein